MEKELDEVELLDDEVIAELVKCFEKVYQRAMKARKWFYHEKKNYWFSPGMLKALIAQGRCDTLMGWKLKYPQEGIENINYEIGKLTDKREKMANEIIAGKFCQ